MNSKIRKFKRAFTLVEILTAVFLGSIIIIAAYSVYLMSYKSYQRHAASAELTQNARIALERMTREVRQTGEILTTAPTEIKFQDGHIPSQIQYLTYYLSGTDLHRKLSYYYCSNDSLTKVKWSTPCAPYTLQEEIDSDNVKAEKITSLQFVGTPVITINLTVSDGNISYQFETKTLARNI